ncbi:TonB-dependent receptor [Pseudoxanthomonas sp. UTMC 1351]|uniref:TonB-dependent receptor domain-containing protein n=1 Tax=Pseudoxanthomonas sp. UTMC 1351 TaxID=2695853 RepID=UPI0034CE5733
MWSPQFISGLNMSLDWWKIRVEDTIVPDTPTQILNDCYVQGDSSRCTRFTRDPVLGYVDAMTFDLINAGFRETEGFDFDLNYRLATGYGDFTVNWQNTYTRRDELKTATDPNALPIQLVGFATTAGATGTFRIRSTLGLGWSRGAFGVNWNARYFSSMKEACLEPNLFPEECSHPGYIARNPQQSGNINRVGSNTFHDLQLRWEAPWDATITFGVNNVFEHIGPPMYSNPNSSTSTKYQGMFDIGRFSYMRYQQRF